MTKEQFQTERTRIISKMLDNPDEHGIYPTTKCYQAFDELYEKLTSDNSDYTKSIEDMSIDELEEMTGECMTGNAHLDL